MIKILLDFVEPFGDDENITQDRTNIDMSLEEYHGLFDHVLTINTGSTEDKTNRLRLELQNLANEIENESVYFHFLGHGCINDGGESIGFQFIMYSELSGMLMFFKERNCRVYLNMLSSCNTSGMASYRDSFDTLWYTDRNIVDTDTPFLLPANYLNGDRFDFENFKQRDGYPSYCEIQNPIG